MNSKEQQKMELLQKLKQQYVSKKKKMLFVEESETYIDIDDIPTDNIVDLENTSDFFLRKSSNVYMVFMALFCFMIGIELYSIFFKNKKFGTDNVGILYGSIGLIITVLKYFLRKPKISIESEGIFFHKWNSKIEWRNVVIVYYKSTTSTNDEVADTKELLIHYYSEMYHSYLLNIIAITDFQKSPEEIIATIKYFKNKGV